MAKNTTKPADPQAEAPSEADGLEAFSESSTLAESSPEEGSSSSPAPQVFRGVPAAPEGPGLLLHPTFAEHSSKQIAARGAIRTAYYCVFGEALPEAVATGWSEGGVVLPCPETVAATMKRICETLGVLTEVVSS